MMGRRAPRRLSAAVGEALELVAPVTPLAAIQRTWAGAVGEAVAREATPVAERSGVITVACSSATWAQELDLLSDQILDRLRSELPDGVVVDELRFTASGGPN